MFLEVKCILYIYKSFILCSPDPLQRSTEELDWIRHVLYFDTLDKTGIETLLVDEDEGLLLSG